MGMGPRTGRGAGFCAGYAGPGYATAGWGRGGGRRGWRHRHLYHATGLTGWQRAAGWPGAMPIPPPAPVPPAPAWTAEQEREALQRQAAWLEQQLNTLRQRLEELRPAPKPGPAE